MRAGENAVVLVEVVVLVLDIHRILKVHDIGVLGFGEAGEPLLEPGAKVIFVPVDQLEGLVDGSSVVEIDNHVALIWSVCLV